MRAKHILTWVFLAFCIFIVSMSFLYSGKARVGPLLVGIPLLVLLVAQIVIENRKKEALYQSGQGTSADEGAPLVTRQAHRFYLEIAGTLIGLIAAIYLFGILIGYALFLFIYLKLYGEKWLFSVVLTAVFSAVIYGLFVIGLRMVLYRGFLLTLILQ